MLNLGSLMRMLNLRRALVRVRVQVRTGVSTFDAQLAY